MEETQAPVPAVHRTRARSRPRGGIWPTLGVWAGGGLVGMAGGWIGGVASASVLDTVGAWSFAVLCPVLLLWAVHSRERLLIALAIGLTATGPLSAFLMHGITHLRFE